MVVTGCPFTVLATLAACLVTKQAAFLALASP
jgi:hypothetical protein